MTLITERVWFPDPHDAEPEGLVAVGGDLRPERLMLAYRTGVFPWSVRPVTWWSPDPRGILELDGLHVSRSLDRFVRKRPFTVTSDRAFSEVMKGCAAPGPGRRSTWITTEFLEAYRRLHEIGHAHSVECWSGNDLVGGVYGVQAGGFFAGESMFHRASNASKVALFALVGALRKAGFELFDIQMLTPVTASLGGTLISRHDYLRRLEVATAKNCTWPTELIAQSGSGLPAPSRK